MSRQVAFVTGSSRGIGLAAALELARHGFDIALNARSGGDELDSAARTVEAEGVKVCKVPLDVAQIGDHDVVLDMIESDLGPVTTLVNNAGVGVMSRGDVLDVTEESYDRCLEVNAKAMFFLSQAFARRIVKRDRLPGLFYSIINVTSSNAVAVAAARGEYCASKAAAAMISKVFAVRLGELGIPVFDVQPGLIATEMTQAVIASYQKRAEEGLCLFPRVGQPEELGAVIASLATGKIPYTTGQAIAVDGGMLLPRY